MLHRKPLTVASLLALLASLSAAAAAYPVAIPPFPHLVATMEASVSPKKLPAKKHVPVTWSVSGKFVTSDGTHPPALREVELDIDKDVKLNVKGYPTCGAKQLKERTSRAAMEACRPAFLGEGRAHVEIAAAEGSPVLAASRLLVFNGGGKGGTAKLLIHAFLDSPSPTAAITRVVMQRRKATGLHTVSKIPVVAGGLGSLIDFTFDLGKTYSYKGKKVGYLEAKCPDGVFKAGVKKLLFKNEAQTPREGASTQVSGNLAVPCTVSRLDR